MNNLKKTSCCCEICKSYCEHKPGWFAPNQVKPVCEFLARPLEELVGEDLMIDFYYGDADDILVLSPNVIGNTELISPFNPRGKCVFFKDGGCAIYPVRPLECQLSIHDMNDESGVQLKREIALSWEKSNILDGFDVEVPEPSLMDWFDLIRDGELPPMLNELRIEEDIESLYSVSLIESLPAKKMAQFVIELIAKILPDGLTLGSLTITKKDAGIRAQLVLCKSPDCDYLPGPPGPVYLGASVDAHLEILCSALCNRIIKESQEIFEGEPDLLKVNLFGSGKVEIEYPRIFTVE